MLCSSPYDIWPLRVKIFTKEAEKIWHDLDKKERALLPLPHACTVSVELEGVDGKSGLAGTGRVDPIEVTDS